MSVKTILDSPHSAPTSAAPLSPATGPALCVRTARVRAELLRAAGVLVHQDQWSLETGIAQIVAETIELVGHRAVDVSVDHGCHQARVLTALGRDVGGQEHRHRAQEVFRVLLLDEALDRALALRIDERPQQADDEAHRTPIHQRLQLREHIVAVQRRHHAAGTIHTRAYADHHLRCDERRRLDDARQVAVGIHRTAIGPAARAADEDRVLEARRGDQSELGAVALDQRIGADGRGVADRFGSFQQPAQLAAAGARQLLQALHEPDGEVVMRGRRF